MRVRIRPGDGLVARSGNGLMVILPGGDDARVDELTGILEQVCATTATPGRALSRQLAGLILHAEEGSIPPFATAAPTDDGWAIMIFGAAEAQVDDGSRLSGREAATWVDRVLPPGFAWLSLGPDPGKTDRLDQRSRLDAGIVPGSGLLLELVESSAGQASASHAPLLVPPPAVPTPEPTEPLQLNQTLPPPPPLPSPPPLIVLSPAPSAEPQMAGTFHVFPLDATQPDALSRVPLPIPGEQRDIEERAKAEIEGVIVDGILCENGHFNHPNALYCAVDGVSTVHRTRTPVKGPRPSLGVIVADDGQTYSLDSNYVVGRDPDQDPAARSAHTRPLRLEDPALSVSRVHAEIQLKGWDVYIVDRGSANGTFVAEGEQGEWVQLTAGQPQLIKSGMRIAFGQRVVTYNTHHQIA
jgi:hypothetical protein